MVHESLRHAVRTALHKATTEKQAGHSPRASVVKTPDGDFRLEVTVTPLDTTRRRATRS